MGVNAFEFNSVAPCGDTDRCSLEAEFYLHVENASLKSYLNALSCVLQLYLQIG